MELEITKDELSDLVKEAAKEPDAFGTLYDYFFPKIYQYIYDSVGDIALTELLVSETFHQVLPEITSLSSTNNFHTYVFTVARELILASCDSNSPNPKVPAYFNYSHNRKLFKVLKELSDRQQEVIYLRFCQGLNSNEISEITDSQEKEVKELLCTGVKKLAKVT